MKMKHGLIDGGEHSLVSLVANLRGSLTFSMNDLERQCDDAERAGTDFAIIVRDTIYTVPLAEIVAHFETHERPDRIMNKDDQIALLERKLSDAQKLIRKQVGDETIAKIAEETPFVQPTTVLRDEGIAEEDKIAVDHKRETMAETTARLARDLAKMKPVVKAGAAPVEGL